MAINQVTLAQFTNEAMAIGAQLNALFSRVQLYASLITSLGTAGLQAAPYSLSAGDATALFNAAQDLDNFRKVYSGLGYVTLGATLNTGVYNNNGASAFGYPFNLSVKTVGGLGY